MSYCNVLIKICFDKKLTESTKYDISLCSKSDTSQVTHLAKNRPYWSYSFAKPVEHFVEFVLDTKIAENNLHYSNCRWLTPIGKQQKIFLISHLISCFQPYVMHRTKCGRSPSIKQSISTLLEILLRFVCQYRCHINYTIH